MCILQQRQLATIDYRRLQILNKKSPLRVFKLNEHLSTHSSQSALLKYTDIHSRITTTSQNNMNQHLKLPKLMARQRVKLK